MIDENYEELTPEASEDVPVSEDVVFTEISPEPVESDPAAGPAPDPAPDPAPAPDPDPVEPSSSVEVVTVDDLLDRLTDESQEDPQTQEQPQTEELLPEEQLMTSSSGSGSDLPAAIIDGGPLEVVGMDRALAYLETIQRQTDEHPEHPMMETPFEDYTVTEGLLLLIFVILLLDFFLNILRRWF